MKPSKFFLLLFSLLLAQPVLALRCGRDLVEIGERSQAVLDKCGEPESVDSHTERRVISQFLSQSAGQGLSYGQQQYTEITVDVEEWVYDFGRRRFQQYLKFENGRLKEIKDLGYGD